MTLSRKDIITQNDASSYVDGGPLRQYSVKVPALAEKEIIAYGRGGWKRLGRGDAVPLELRGVDGIHFEGLPPSALWLIVCKIPEGYLTGAAVEHL
jgi:hypothetical protein